MKNRSGIFRWIKIIIITYCAIGIALYYLQEIFLFHPHPLDSHYKYQFDKKFEEIMLPVNKTDTLSMVKFFPEDSIRKGVVLYYHGNRNNIAHYSGYTNLFLKKGYEVWIGDYPGYGKTTGERTEKKIYDQAMIIYSLAKTKYAADSIIIYGKSLGTGIAAYVASYSPAKMLVLETPYYSIPSLFRDYAFIYPVTYMSTYKIPTYTYLSEVRYPVIIFHGTGDDVIQYSNAKKLLPVLKPGDQFITIKGGGHNTLGRSTEYKTMMDSLLR